MDVCSAPLEWRSAIIVPLFKGKATIKSVRIIEA
jgi:hypothetical protein